MIIMIAAVAKNNVIGRGNDLPWHIPEDLQHFKQLTAGKTVLMGKHTYDSIISRNGHPLPKRKNIVITSDSDFKPEAGVVVFPALAEAKKKLSKEEVWVIGGASIYEQMMPFADELYITHIAQTVEGDTFFPEIVQAEWDEIGREDFPGFSFVHYRRHI